MAVMINNTEIKILSTPAEVFQKAAADFAARAESAIKSKGVFTVVLSGGNTAKLFFAILAESYKQPISWEQIQFFFGDERYLPATDIENNYHIAREHLFAKVGVPAKNIHRIPTEFPDPKNAAEDYEQTLRTFFSINNNAFPQFDVIYLGLGENAHTASLMPLSDVVIKYVRNPIRENNQLVAALWVPELNMYRITLTPNAINPSGHIIFLVTGQSKALAVQKVLEGPLLPEQYPAQLIHSLNGKTTWYLDQAAAKKINYTAFELNSTIHQLISPGKGILAADESEPTITKRFAEIDLKSTVETRRAYRDLLFTTPNINNFIQGIILYDETIQQTTKSGQLFPDFLCDQDILIGIKVDKGLVPLVGTNNEFITEGLDGLAQRLTDYKKLGAKFAKWRATFTITDQLPSQLAITENAEYLARYAAICQSLGIVPIVEPEVLMDGDHTLERCAAVSTEVLRAVFSALVRNQVILEYMILKPSMILPGKTCTSRVSVNDVAQATITVLRETVPAAVPSINFLSGGQSTTDATLHLNAINKLGPQPWVLSFSFARALQEPCLHSWQGKEENVKAAQLIFYQRAEFNSAACLGQYQANKAIFLDADGVLNTAIIKDGKPVAPTTLAELQIPAEVKPALEQLKAAGYLLICVTNKPDVERGLMTQATVDAIYKKIHHDLPLDDVFICYHEHSDCYKPKPGLLLEAAKKYTIDLSQSYMIGDRWRDVGAGQNALCKTIWIDRGYAEQKPKPPADFTVHSLAEATQIILKSES